MPAHQAQCRHRTLIFNASPHSTTPKVGYTQPTSDKRLAATQLSGRAAPASFGGSAHPLLPVTLDGTFPAPLVLPGDELAYDPKAPQQSLRSWRNEGHRNRLDVSEGRTQVKRNVLYVVGAPDANEQAWRLAGKRMPTWLNVPGIANKHTGKGRKARALTEPAAEDVAAYLSAFYWPLEVKVWDGQVAFLPWTDSAGSKLTMNGDAVGVGSVGLRVGETVIRVRTRRPPDEAFEGQLNLNDLLDGVIELLPDDAYAVSMLVRQDMYESDEDDFCCGRAYGGSRISCVSTARYRPGLYIEDEGSELHTWPASHCADFVSQLCESVAVHATAAEGTAMRAAVEAVSTVKQDKSSLWLSRVSKTTAHELGHCFGLAHCGYHACVMQGTASLEEDERQPPYLCPIDVMKLAWAMDEVGAVDMENGLLTQVRKNAIGRTKSSAREIMTVREWMERRHRAMKEHCEKYEGSDRMSTAFAAWLGHQLKRLEAHQQSCMAF